MSQLVRPASAVLRLPLVLLVLVALAAGVATAAADPEAPVPAAQASSVGEGSADGLGATGLRVVDASLVGHDSWGAWFGFAPRRMLLLTLENDGSGAITDPEVSLRVGRTANPASEVPVPPLGTLGPGEKRRYAVPVTFDRFAMGSYSAAGHIEVGEETLTFAASTTSYPWALIVLPFVVGLEILLIVGRNRLRRAYLDSSARTSIGGSGSGVEVLPVDVDALVDAAVRGAFSIRDRPARETPAPPRAGALVDVRPIVSTVARRGVPRGAEPGLTTAT